MRGLRQARPPVFPIQDWLRRLPGETSVPRERRHTEQFNRMIRFLQANLRKMRLARNLLEQAARESRSDLLIINEQPRGPSDDDYSFSDLDFSAQLVLTRFATVVAWDVERGRYHVEAGVHDIAVFLCYLPPSLLATQFRPQRGALGLPYRTDVFPRRSVQAFVVLL